MIKTKKYNTKKRRTNRRKWAILLVATAIGILSLALAYLATITPVMAQTTYQAPNLLRTPNLTLEQHVWTLLMDEGGLPFEDAMRGMEIVNCESRWDKYAINFETKDFGLWQISEHFHGDRISREDMFDVYASTRYAVKLYKEWGSWDAWVCNK